MSFTSALELFADNTGEKMDTVVRSVLLKIGNSLIQMSPVGNPEIWVIKDVQTGEYRDYLSYREPPAGYVGGRFRAGWQLGVGQPVPGIVETEDKSGSITKSKLASAISKISAGNVHYITNNSPYGLRLEYGWSTQAPAGFVRVTASRFRRLLKQAAKDVR